MTTPTDVIVRTIQGNINRSTRGLAEAVAGSLVHNQVVAVATEALVSDGWLETDGGLTRENLEHIARTVLRSVSGA